jgi:O-antigen/teichoic acid export membrane protein
MTPPSEKRQKPEHSHPGGAGAALGAHLARFSSMQGLSLLITNILHYGSIAVVAGFLGPKPLGAYALLFFLTGLVTQLIGLAVRPGTMMRTFGVADADEDDVEEEEGKEEKESASTRPTYTLGVGLIWCLMLCGSVVALAIVFGTQISQFLLNDPGQADVIVLATITGAAWAIFKIAEMVIWFEGRGLTYALTDAARPAFNLIAIVAILAGGSGVKGAVVGQTIGTTAATVLVVALIWKSFELGFSFGEVKEILKRGKIRVPIASSMWLVQNADSFILSRFLDHKSIGLYNLASRTGFMVAFLPQGFRIALRPIRKTAVYEAYRKEYGLAVANGQLLAYFYLITLTAVLAMVLGGEILIQVAGHKFESAAPIIPLTAAAMSMPALYRTIGAMSSYPNKRRNFILATIFVALAYIGFMLLLLGETGIGIYAAPISLLLAFGIPSTAMFLRSQLGDRPIDFPYLAMLEATGVAILIAGGFHLFHPTSGWLKLGAIAVLMVVWIASLFLLRIIPSYHWHPIRHIVVSALRRGSALRFDPRAALGSLEASEREALRKAVFDRMAPAELVPSGGDGANADEAVRAGDGTKDRAGSPGADGDVSSEGARLVGLLRRAGRHGGIPIAERSEHDDGISLFLFSNQPFAMLMKKMRELLAAGADAHELRTLEDLRNDLAKVPKQTWSTQGAGNGRRRADGGKGRGRKGRPSREPVKRA